jgi:hypothetical protein
MCPKPDAHLRQAAPSNDGDLGGGDTDDDLASRQAPNAEFIMMIIAVFVAIVIIFIITMVTIFMVIIFNMILVVDQSPEGDEDHRSEARVPVIDYSSVRRRT